jgi:hypothetical protein
VLFTEEELREGSDEPGVLDGSCIGFGFEVLSMRGGSSGTPRNYILTYFGILKIYSNSLGPKVLDLVP